MAKTLPLLLTTHVDCPAARCPRRRFFFVATASIRHDSDNLEYISGRKMIYINQVKRQRWGKLD